MSGLRKARLSDVESADATLRSAYFAEVAFGYEGCKPTLRSASQYSVGPILSHPGRVSVTSQPVYYLNPEG